MSVIVSAPVRAPDAVGLKVTEMEQLAPETTFEPHVFVSAKSPEAFIDAMLRADPPELVSVTACAGLAVPCVWDAKVRVVGETVTLLDEMPAPVSETVWGEPEALSVIVREPERVPAAVGVNVTEMVQLVPEARLEPQFWVSAKSPEAAIDVMDSAVEPAFVNVTFCAALVVPVA